MKKLIEKGINVLYLPRYNEDKDMIEANPVYQAREISRLTDTQVMAADDGTTIDPVEHASKTRQKKLESFDGPDVQTDEEENKQEEE